MKNHNISISQPWIILSRVVSEMTYTVLSGTLNSSIPYPISIKFGMQMQVSIPRMDIWQKMEILQIQDGGQAPYWK